MDALVRGAKRKVAKFDPKKTKDEQAKASAVIGYAQEVKDWPLLMDAVERKIEDQRKFVAWWKATVRPAGRKWPDNLPTDAQIISHEVAERDTGIDHRVVSRWQKGLKDVEAYRSRMYGAAYAEAMGLDKKTAKAWRREAAARELPSGECRLICADIENVEIAPSSVDVILTDPPYPEEYLGVYETLARRSNNWLKDGGSLLCMCGQSFLPQIVAAMARHMKYQWTLAYLTPGGQATQLWERKVNTFWKPVLWFVKGEYRGEWIGDVTASAVNDNDKRFHDWGQSESGIADLLGRFAVPGQTIFDPFVGGGTTAAVALAMGMHFIGSDIDQAAIDKLRQPR